MNSWIFGIPQYAIIIAALLVLVACIAVFSVKSAEFHKKRVSHFERARKRMKQRRKRMRMRMEEEEEDDDGDGGNGYRMDGHDVQEMCDRDTVLDALDVHKLIMVTEEGLHHHHHHQQQHPIQQQQQQYLPDRRQYQFQRLHEHERSIESNTEMPLSQSFNEVFINRLIYSHRRMLAEFQKRGRESLFEEGHESSVEDIHGLQAELDEAMQGPREAVSGFASAMEKAASSTMSAAAAAAAAPVQDTANVDDIIAAQRRSFLNGGVRGGEVDPRPIATTGKESRNLSGSAHSLSQVGSSSRAHLSRILGERPSRHSLVVKVTPKSLLTPEFVQRKNREFVAGNNMVPDRLKRCLLEELDPSERLYWFDMPQYQAKKRKTLRNVVIYICMTVFLSIMFACMALFVVIPENALSVSIVGAVAALIPLAMSIRHIPSLMYHNVCYALTSKRAIFCRRKGLIWRRFSVVSYPYSKMQGIYCQNERRVGKLQCYLGDVLFCRDEVAEKNALMFGWKIDPNSSDAVVGFRSIYQLYEVHKLLLFKFVVHELRPKRPKSHAERDQDQDLFVEDLNAMFIT